MFSGASQQQLLLLLLLLFNVTPDGFQAIHIQAGMMRWLQAGEDQHEVSVQPCHRHSLSSLPVPVAVRGAPELEFGVLGVLSFKNYFSNY